MNQKEELGFTIRIVNSKSHYYHYYTLALSGDFYTSTKLLQYDSHHTLTVL